MAQFAPESLAQFKAELVAHFQRNMQIDTPYNAYPALMQYASEPDTLLPLLPADYPLDYLPA